jgi:hypothetical protein
VKLFLSIFYARIDFNSTCIDTKQKQGISMTPPVDPISSSGQIVPANSSQRAELREQERQTRTQESEQVRETQTSNQDIELTDIPAKNEISAREDNNDEPPRGPRGSFVDITV